MRSSQVFMNVAVSEELKQRTERAAELLGVSRGVIQRWALVDYLAKLEKEKTNRKVKNERD